MDFLFPPYCAGCGLFSFRFCPACYKDIQPLDHFKICPHCGNILLSSQCEYCTSTSFVLESFKSLGIYRTSLRNAILQLKFQHNLGLGDEFVPSLKQVFLSTNWQIDLITSVPVSSKRLSERGYNQAEIIASPLALSLDIPFEPRSLSKIKEARSQVGLSFDERMNNIQHAFKANSRFVNGKNVMVIDDVSTTGATLNACAHAMLDSGAKKVYGLTLAKTLFNSKNRLDFIVENI